MKTKNPQGKSKRKWQPWELNWLKRHDWGVWEIDLAGYGEKPVEYITGWVEFSGEKLKVNRKVLIPRVETEELIEHVSKDLHKIAKNGQKTIKIVEVGTGSGAIALVLQQKMLKIGLGGEIWAIDVSAEALEVAQANEEIVWESKSASEQANREKTQISWLQSDLLEELPANLKVDLVVANLPYIPKGRKKELATSVVDYEPHQALFGGEDGLELVRRLLAQAPPFLTPEGIIWLEIDDTHDVKKFGREFPAWKIKEYFDSYGRRRFWKLRQKEVV